MISKGAVFEPELIELMKAVLEDTAAGLPQAKRTCAVKAEIASAILATAATGVRDRNVMKKAALLAIVDPDISPECRMD